MRSLFEEQIVGEQMGRLDHIEAHQEGFAEALSFFPRSDEYAMRTDDYLELLQKIKGSVGVPVIASLNGVTEGGWIGYAGRIAEAGADALELNMYYLASNLEESGEDIERRTLGLLKAVKEATKIPVAAKISPFYSSMANFAKKVDDLGVDGMVLFNRFYQPDIDTEELEVAPELQLSDSSELLLRLRWLALLSGRLNASLALSGGVHTAQDAIKGVMAGAHAVQIVSALLLKEPEYLRTIQEEMAIWMEEREYESLKQMQGSMNLLRSPDPGAYERANYMRVLQSWQS
jgi:dihydroorotate dehydrogenase (fumarate)